MPKFLTGFTLGVFTGWLFHDTISQNIRKAVDYGNEKIDDLEKEEPPSTDPFADATPEHPVTLTDDDIEQLGYRQVKAGVESGRFIVEERP